MDDEVIGRSDLVSECCGAKSLGEVYYCVNKAMLGICAQCRDQAVFSSIDANDDELKI
jgi:hypothetical protein